MIVPDKIHIESVNRLCQELHLPKGQAKLEVGWMAASSAGTGNPGACFEKMVEARVAGKPLAHIIRTVEFMDLELHCGPAALAPRPETETLVEVVLEHHKRLPKMVCDLGTGTGAIAACLARFFPDSSVYACENSKAACELAHANFEALGIDNVTLVQEDWNHLDMVFDLLVSNPPYVSSAHCDQMERDRSMHDPRIALDGGKDGLQAIRSIFKAARKLLAQDGEIFIEHGVGQLPAVRGIANEHGMMVASSHRDLQKLCRVARACKKA